MESQTYRTSTRQLFVLGCLLAFIGVMSYLIAPLITEYHIQSLLTGGLKRSMTTGKIETGIEPYKTSPFGVDYVIEDAKQQTFTFYATGIAPDQRAKGDAAETMTVFLSRPTRMDVTYEIDDVAHAQRPRFFVYNDLSRMIDTGNLAGADSTFAPLVSPYQLSSPLPAGLFRVRHMFLREDVSAIHVTFTPETTAKDTAQYDRYVMENIKTLHFDILPGQMARLNELRAAQEINWARLPAGDWSQRYLPGPKEAIQLQVRSEHGDWAFAELKLSGRNAAHKSEGGLPSSDIQIKAGQLPYGLKKFKLYVAKSKTNGYDMFMERFVNDMGLPINREDLVKIVVNGDVFGYMQLYEDFDTSLFEAGQYVEGPVFGYDTDPLIANAGHSWFSPRSYYMGKEIPLSREIDMGTTEMPQWYCPFAMGNTLATGVFYSGMHGLGSDTRFLYDFRRNCVNPVYKDFNTGVYSVTTGGYQKTKSFARNQAVLALRLLSVMTPNWRPYTPTYASYFVTRNEKTPDKQGFYFYWTVQPPVMNYSNDAARDGEFYMAMERMYGDAHTDRFAHRRENFMRATQLLNDTKLDSGVLTFPSKPTTIEAALPFTVWGDLMDVPASCDDTYLRSVIQTASAGAVVPDCRELHRLAWRNGIVQSLLTVDPADKLGQNVTKTELTKPHTTFLYQKDTDSTAYLFFAQRACASGCEGTFWLMNDQTGERIDPVSTVMVGSEHPPLTQMDLLLQNISDAEQMRVFAFAIPKTAVYQHLIPHYAGSGFYYGSHGVAVMPALQRPDHAKSVTTVNPDTAPAPLETFFDVHDKTLTWKKGIAAPNERVYIPKGYTWKVDQPLKVNLEKHGCFEIWGDVQIADDAKLELTDNGDGWSGIHFFENRELTVQHLFVSNGGYNEEFVYCGSRRYTGIVEFFETNVHLKDMHISHNMSEDGMHLVHTDMILDDSSITGTASDAVDSDYSALVLRNFTIIGAGTLGENGGDALDFSGSLAELHGMHLKDSADKNISCGENSVVHVYDSDLVNGNFGIAIKDASTLSVQRTTITGSHTGIGIYSKKPYYPRPTFDLAAQDVTFKDVGVAFNPEASPN